MISKSGPSGTPEGGPPAGDPGGVEDRRRLILDSALDAILSMDAQGRILDWNKRAESLFGWRAAEVVGKPLVDVVVPERYRAAHSRGMKHFLETGEGPFLNHRIEVEGLRRDGTEFPVELTVTPARIGGEWIFSSFLRDLSEQKAAALRLERAEEDLRRREEQLELIMDAVPALISYIGADFRYRFNNKAYEDWFGIARADITGRPVWEVLGESAYARLKPHLDAALAGEPQSVELEVPYQGGGTRFIRGHYLPHRNAAGIVEGLIVLVLDLTERRAIEQALREKEGFLESIYNGAEEAVFVVDVTPAGGFAFVGFNPAYFRLAAAVGIDAATLPGRTTRELPFPPEVIAGVEAKYGECVRTGVSMEYEEQALLGGKATHWLTRIAPLKDGSGRIYRLVGTSTNITRQKEDAARIRQAEEQLRQGQKMEAIGRLAGGIAHDFNNLLTAINGYATLLVNALPEGGHSQMAGEIARAGEKAARLTSQLLAFSRKQVLLPEVLDINAVLEGMETLLRRVIGEHIAMVTAYEPNLPKVRLDRGRLEQVILNLCINARDAMAAGGTLTLSSASAAPPGDADAGERPPGGWVRMTVADTGVGMSGEIQARIFEPFFTTKDAGRGTGMGLATVYGIVQQSGGSIQVTSAPGKGSSFSVFFPAGARVQAPAAPGKAAVRPGSSPRGKVILLVEDEEVVRTFACKVLEDRGYVVKTAGSGEEGLEILDRDGEGIHLLIADTVLPGMGGAELARTGRDRHPRLRILFISGYMDQGRVAAAGLPEGVAVLDKPFGPSQLAEWVAEALSAD